MEGTLAGAGKEVLVEIVKFIQRKGMRGDKGAWKEFLASYDDKLGSNLSDPARRSADVLLSFIKTFKKESDLKLLAKLIKCRSNHEVAKQFAEPKDGESPEQRLVRMTFEHPHYPIDYAFPSHEKDWVITKVSKKNKDLRLDKLLAVDCEMVLCEDGSEALVKICVVDRNLKVKLHEFVNPGKAVVDYRTSITGVSAEDLSSATLTLPDIQHLSSRGLIGHNLPVAYDRGMKSMRKLLSGGAILVGHSLSNDLKVLKIDHARVIDTSFIFKYGDDSMQKKPSLNNLCKSVLGSEVRKKGATHDCLDDACAAMRLVLAKMEHGFDDVLPINREKVPDGETTKLLIHRIPISMPIEHLNRIIHGEFTIEVQNNKKGKGDRYSALATFATPEEALETYTNLEGDELMDSFGLPQKSISVKLGSGQKDSIYVRKMAREGPPEQAASKKRPCPTEETSGGHKLLKTTTDGDETSRLKKLVSEKDEEINRLSNVVKEKDGQIERMENLLLALTRKQGLC